MKAPQDHPLGDARARLGPLMTAQEVGALLGVSESWVRAEARAGRLPVVVLGKHRRFRLDELEAYIEHCTRGPRGR